MRKPILVFTFRQGMPNEEEKAFIHNEINKNGIKEEYHVFVIFQDRIQGCTKGNTIELLQKGRKSLMIKNLDKFLK